MIKKVLIKTIDAIDPKCHRCGQRFFPFSNCRKKLNSLKPVGEYKTEYDKITKLCKRCWGNIRTVECSLCGSPLDAFKNKKKALLYNLINHSVNETSVQIVKRICPKCFKNLAYVQCSRCRKQFKSIENKKHDYTKISDYLRPYHPNYSDEWDDLCPTCYQEYLSSSKKVQLILKNWVGGTKREFVRGYKTLKSLDRVEYAGTSCRNPAEVEEYLKLYSAQLGGHGFKDFFWQKHEQKHAEKVLAGYSDNNNPYYQTKYWTERWFTGYATAVIVEEFKKKTHKQKQENCMSGLLPARIY